MIDPVQAAVGIIVMLVVVGAFLYIFYSRTNAVEKTGYGALIMLAVVSLMIPVFWILEANGEAMAKTEQHKLAVQRGAALYAQYCFQCHGTQGQGLEGKGGKLNNNPDVNNLKDTDLLRIIGSGFYDPTNPGNKNLAPMPAFSQQYGGPLTEDDIQYLFELIRSSDPNYLAKNGYPTGKGTNGFDQVGPDLQGSNPVAYATAVAQEASGQFGQPTDMTNQKAITITIVDTPAGASCTPACYTPMNVKVKVGTKITWVNKSSSPHTVTAITNTTSKTPAPQIFDSGAASIINVGSSFSYTVTAAAYNFNSSHTVVYFCRLHPTGMFAELTIVQ
jgi:plastocyanin/mono/diheme cytochrome c family protein